MKGLLDFLLPSIFTRAALSRVETSSAPGPLHLLPRILELPPKKCSLMRGAPPDFISLHVLHFQSMYLLILVANCHPRIAIQGQDFYHPSSMSLSLKHCSNLNHHCDLEYASGKTSSKYLPNIEKYISNNFPTYDDTLNLLERKLAKQQ